VDSDTAHEPRWLQIPERLGGFDLDPQLDISNVFLSQSNIYGEGGILPEDAQLETEAKQILVQLYGDPSLPENRAARQRTIAVGRIIDSEGRQKKVISSSEGYLTPDEITLLESQGYEIIPNTRKEKNIHAEERMINWAEAEIASGRIQGIEAIGVSHPGGICTYFCRPLLEQRGIRPGSRWNDRWSPSPRNPRRNEPPRQ
jgi:hypothetical protein